MSFSVAYLFKVIREQADTAGKPQNIMYFAQFQVGTEEGMFKKVLNGRHRRAVRFFLIQNQLTQVSLLNFPARAAKAKDGQINE